eukprot:2394272-Pyramimonas_sp.AAC.1
MIHFPFPWLLSYRSSCLPLRDALWDTSIRRRRYPRSTFLSLLLHGQAVYPHLSLLSGVGYILVCLALISCVLYTTPYHGTVEYLTVPALSQHAPNILEYICNLVSYNPISPPRGHTPRTTQTPIPIRKLTATSDQTPSRNFTDAIISND